MTNSMRADAAVRMMQESLDRGRGLCLLVGTGLTIAATGDHRNSWAELIKSGAAACEKNGVRDQSWVDRVAADVDTALIGDMLAAAEKVTWGLGGQSADPFYRWLEDTVGAVKPRNVELLDEVKRLSGNQKVTVVTTNYDTLLADYLQVHPVTWRDDTPVLHDAYVDHRRRAVIHIHGHWRNLASVVFGSASYASLRAHHNALVFLEQLLLANTMVTVGVGAGLEDPTFKFLLDWAASALDGTRSIYYLHVAGATVPTHPSITPVPLATHAKIVDLFRQIQITQPKPTNALSRSTEERPFSAAILRRVRRLAESGAQTPEAMRARRFAGVYRDVLDRVLSDTEAPDDLTRAWADRLEATWLVFNEPRTPGV